MDVKALQEHLTCKTVPRGETHTVDFKVDKPGTILRSVLPQDIEAAVFGQSLRQNAFLAHLSVFFSAIFFLYQKIPSGLGRKNITRSSVKRDP